MREDDSREMVDGCRVASRFLKTSLLAKNVFAGFDHAGSSGLG